MKSASTIYRQSGSKLGFKNWLENEKMSHDLNLAKGNTKRDFDEWLELKYAKKSKNASGNVEAAKNILKKTAEKMDDSGQSTIEAPPAPTEKTILGMKPVIFYTVAGGLALVAIVAIVKLRKK
jgi:hypothetical protein